MAYSGTTVYYGAQFRYENEASPEDALEQFIENIPRSLSANLSREGYTLVGWLYNDKQYSIGEMYSAIAPTSFVAVWAKNASSNTPSVNNLDNMIMYKVISNVNNTYQINGSADKIFKVSVDGIKVDSSCFVISTDFEDTVISFTDEYINSLIKGLHNVLINYKDGYCYFTFTI